MMCPIYSAFFNPHFPYDYRLCDRLPFNDLALKLSPISRICKILQKGLRTFKISCICTRFYISTIFKVKQFLKLPVRFPGRPNLSKMGSSLKDKILLLKEQFLFFKGRPLPTPTHTHTHRQTHTETRSKERK